MPTLSILVPVYNEASDLAKVIERLMSSPCPIPREWIFINDASTDGSQAVLDRLQPQFGFRVIGHAQNQGKGASVIRGIKEATGEIIMVQDADFEYDPADIPQLLQPILEDRADVVYGSRYQQSAPLTFHTLVNRLLTMLSNWMSGLALTDMETCYKVFRADFLKSMNLISARFGIEVEMTAYLAKTRARLVELPISYQARTHREGKKINWKDGIAALRHLIYFNYFRSTSLAFASLPAKYQV